MDKELDTIQKNIVLAKHNKLIYDTVCEGQLAELTELIADKISDDKAMLIFTDAFAGKLCSEDFARFCLMLSQNNRLLNQEITPIYDNTKRISYMKNAYSSEAISKFFCLTGGIYDDETNFISVCEAVYSGRSTYAILPLYNTNDGLMISLYKLIQKYELKITAVTTVILADRSTEMTFCLLSKKLLIIKKPDFVSISVIPESDDLITELLYVLRGANIKMRTINTLPLEYTNDRHESIIEFDIHESSFETLRCFLKNALPDINVLGIYSKAN